MSDQLDIKTLKSFPVYMDLVKTYYKKQYGEIEEKEALTKIDVLVKNLKGIIRENDEIENTFINTILYNGDGWKYHNKLSEILQQALMDNDSIVLEELTKTRVEAESGMVIINIDHEFAFQDEIKTPYYGESIKNTILNDPVIKECFKMTDDELDESKTKTEQNIKKTEDILNSLKEDDMTKEKIEEILKDPSTRATIEEVLKQSKKEEEDMSKKEETKQEETKKEETKKEETGSKTNWKKIALYTTGAILFTGAVAAGVYFYKERDVLVVSEDEI